MRNIERIPMKAHPRLFDIVIGEMQQGLAAQLPWLSHAFGKAERLVKIIQGRRYYTPNVYTGGNDYELIAPDSNFGNYCFFTLDEPQGVAWSAGDMSTVRAPFSVIFWVDMRTIPDAEERNTEAVKRQILRALNGGIFVRSGRFSIARIYERAENIFKGFTLDEVDNQFLMHPFCGWRFEGEIVITDSCL